MGLGSGPETLSLYDKLMSSPVSHFFLVKWGVLCVLVSFIVNLIQPRLARERSLSEQLSRSACEHIYEGLSGLLSDTRRPRPKEGGSTPWFGILDSLGVEKAS